MPENWLTLIGLPAGLLVVAGLGDQVARALFKGTIRRIAKRTTSTWDDRLIERKVFARLAHIVPALILYYGIGPALFVSTDLLAEPTSSTAALIAVLVRRVSLAFIVVAIVLAANAFLNAINDIYNDSYEEAKNRPIKGYLQVVGLGLWIAGGVVVVSLLADQSPVVFLSGLGALTAVLMLVFRDTILSLVASLQIMSNDMIRIGDWVSMPQANADGDVIDIALHTVKVQNWDKTITTIPTYKFISESFKNWRGMSESGGRRIKRSLAIDMSSIRFLGDDEIERFARSELLHNYMTEKQEALTRYADEKKALGPDVEPVRRALTNIGTFRAYVLEYLKANPKVHKDMTLLVRQLAPTPQGLPLEVYCFTTDTAWAHYEGIQGDIFDHLMAVLPQFGLEAFQEPSGRDFARLGPAVKAPVG
ncbi:MAG: mechanosensitive ion channel [Gemmatimonadota bacterium]|jgi:miniconductance mechanosensitive channel